MTQLEKNSVLGMLPAAVLERFGTHLVPIRYEPGDVLLEAGEPIVDVHFPLDLVASLEQVVTTDPEDRAGTPGIALVGSEGVIGIEALLGADTATNTARVGIGGHAVRIRAEVLREEFLRASALHRVLLRHTDALFLQTCAISACERVHPVQQRLIRWLLSFDDRSPIRDLGLTQDTLARLLAVRRVSISAAALGLQVAGLIAYQRGHVMVVDREGMEARSCKCYREIKARYDLHLHPE